MISLHQELKNGSLCDDHQQIERELLELLDDELDTVTGGSSMISDAIKQIGNALSSVAAGGGSAGVLSGGGAEKIG